MKHWKKALGLTGLVVLGAYAGLLGLVYAKQNDFVYFPPPANPSAPFDISIQRPDTKLGGWIVHPRTGPSRDALVVFGGNAMSLRQQGTGLLSACTDRTLVLVPYRGYEGNPGVPSEKRLIDDGLATVSWARQNFDHVGVLGISLGSGVALGVAEQAGTGIDLVALGTPYDRLDLVGQDHMSWALPGLLMHDRFDNLSRITKVKAPVFGMRAAFDKVVLPARSRALMEVGVGRWDTLPGDHDTVWHTPVACQWLLQSTRAHVAPVDLPQEARLTQAPIKQASKPTGKRKRLH